jgi:hypothetical protein
LGFVFLVAFFLVLFFFGLLEIRCLAGNFRLLRSGFFLAAFFFVLLQTLFLAGNFDFFAGFFGLSFLLVTFFFASALP